MTSISILVKVLCWIRGRNLLMNVSFKPATHFAAKPKAQKPQQHQQKEVVLEQKPAQFQKGHGAQV
jgi:hypothetical protein